MGKYYSVILSSDYLEHHGILGMKWGIRRYQNKDGSLTPEGAKHYAKKLANKNEIIRIHAVNRQRALNNSQGKVNYLLKSYEQYAKDNNITDRNKQFKDINKIHATAYYKDPNSAYWMRRADESDSFMLNREIDYDDYCNKLVKRFGTEGMEQIRSATTPEMMANSEKYLKDQTKLREVYEQLKIEADDILNKYDVARDKK